MKFGNLAIRFLRNESGVSAIEFAFIAPAFLMLLGLVLFAGEGFAVQRKVNMTARTLVDLAAQQDDLSPGSSTFTAKDIINAAALTMAPYNTGAYSVTLYEVLINDQHTGTVLCQVTRWGMTGCPATNSSWYFPPDGNMQSLIPGTYVLIGVVNFYHNFPILNDFISYTKISRTIYMTPRNSTGYIKMY